MSCSRYGFTISGSDSRCFFSTSSSMSISTHRSIHVKFPIRINFRSLNVKATAVDDGVVAVSFYDLLGIPESGSLPEIKQAYKQLARKYHPDVSPPDRAEEYTKRFIQVQEAYETLSDPRRRAMYDIDMARGLNLAFSVRRRYYDEDEAIEQKSKWKTRWQSQLSDLQRRSKCKEAGGNVSWAARVRRKRDDTSIEL